MKEFDKRRSVCLGEFHISLSIGGMNFQKSIVLIWKKVKIKLIQIQNRFHYDYCRLNGALQSGINRWTTSLSAGFWPLSPGELVTLQWALFHPNLIAISGSLSITTATTTNQSRRHRFILLHSLSLSLPSNCAHTPALSLTESRSH